MVLSIVLPASGRAAQAGSEAERTCVPGGHRVLIAAGQARVYRFGPELWACRPGIRFRIGFPPAVRSPEPCNNPVDLIRLQPHYVAWQETASCNDQQIWNIHLRTLGHGGFSYSLADGVNACGDTCPDYGVGPSRALVLAPDGDVAWIADDANVGGVSEVWKRPLHGARSRLARGPRIDAPSLRWSGTSVRWVQGGVVHRG
jgi:hypothetical protein